MRKTVALLLCVLLPLPFSAACRGEPQKRYTAEFLDLFDTVTQITGLAESKEEFTEFAREIQNALRRYHQLFDIYNDYEGINNIKTVNDAAGRHPVKTDPAVIELLKLAKEMYAVSGGKMNVALGPVLKLWHDARERAADDPESAAVPDIGALKAAARHVDLNDVVLDEEAGTVYLPRADMRLDVGSVGKGFAVNKVFYEAVEAGHANFALSVGGNVMAHGTRDGKGTPWRISLQNPDTESDREELFKIRLSGRALVTSGNYQRYFYADGVRYHHLIDPDTLMPADRYAAVSVLCDDSGLADCLSTALYCLPEEEGRKLLARFPGAAALYVYEDGRQSFAGGFEQYIIRE